MVLYFGSQKTKTSKISHKYVLFRIDKISFSLMQIHIMIKNSTVLLYFYFLFFIKSTFCFVSLSCLANNLLKEFCGEICSPSECSVWIQIIEFLAEIENEDFLLSKTTQDTVENIFFGLLVSYIFKILIVFVGRMLVGRTVLSLN